MKSDIKHNLFAVLCCCAISASASISFVDIGNLDNAADTNGDSDRNGFGKVGYAYQISREEITVGDFTASPVSHGTTRTNANDAMTQITRHEAAQYANWLTSGDVSVGVYTISGGLITGITARDSVGMTSLVSTYGTVYALPTEDEFYKAAYFTGSTYFNYANGTDIAPSTSESRYNTSSPWLVGSGLEEQNNGTYDMMGNVWEWLEQEGTLRGGSYAESSSFLRAANRALGVSDSRFDDVGMRIVAIPEPGTISLMSLSTLGIFFTRTARRRKMLGRSLLPVRRERLCDTYFTSPEEQMALEQTEAYESLLDTALQACVAQVATVSSAVGTRYKTLDKMFWNRMVIRHEQKVAKRQALKTTVKKKALDGLDSFLARIMK